MKKTLIIILSIAVIGVVGVFAYNIIGKNEPKENEGIVDNSQVGENTGNSEDKDLEQGNDNTKEDGKVLQIPYNEIYFTSPDGWNVAECDDSYVICQTSDCLVNISYQWHVEFDGQLDDVIDLLIPRFCNDAALYSKGLIDKANMEVISTENCTIGGYDGVHFTAKIRNRNEWDCHVYGYAMIVDNIPIMVTGLVSAKAQDADMIAQIDTLTDQIAESIHVKK